MFSVVFVGDEPSKKNISKDIPFGGAKCFKRLTEWIAFLKPDYYIVLNKLTGISTGRICQLLKAA